VQLGVARVGRQALAEVLEVTVQVHVLVRDAAHMRKAVRVQRMDVQHRHARCLGLGAPVAVMQGKHLHTAAAVALHPVAGAADDQQLLGIRRAVQHYVHRQGFAVASR
jgi:hypothetical protein